MTDSAQKRPLEKPEEDLELTTTPKSDEPEKKKAKMEEAIIIDLEDEELEEEDLVEPEKDSFTVEQERRKAQLLEIFEKCEQLGGANFEAEQQRVLNELSKQRDTIKGLLDELRVTKAERAAQNVSTTSVQRTSNK
ncbi:unnamed protein product [Caenorhabditis brenneri]